MSVVADSRFPRDGRFIERLGHFNPLLPKDSELRLKLDMDKVKAWMAKGAQPSDRVMRFLDAAGVAKRAARNNPEKGRAAQGAQGQRRSCGQGLIASSRDKSGADLRCRIGAAHGVRGEVKLWPFTEDPMAVVDYGPLSTKDGARQFEVVRARVAKDHLVATLKGVTTRDDAERINGIRTLHSRVTACRRPRKASIITPI